MKWELAAMTGGVEFGEVKKVGRKGDEERGAFEEVADRESERAVVPICITCLALISSDKI